MRKWTGFRTYGDAKMFASNHGGLVCFSTSDPIFKPQNRLYHDIINNEGTDYNLFPFIVYKPTSEGSKEISRICVEKPSEETYNIFALSAEGEIINYVYGVSAETTDLHEYIEWSFKK